MALYEAIFRSTLYGQQVINRFHYSSGGAPASVSGSFALAYALGTVPDGIPPVWPDSTVFSEMRQLQSADIDYQELEVRSLYNLADFYVRPFPVPTSGLVVEPSAAPFLAFGLNSNRVTRAVRAGQKRIAGVVEAAMGDGGEVVGNYVTQLGNLATAMSAVLSYDDEGNTVTFSPCVLAYQEYTTPRGKKAYKPYATLEAQLAHAAVGVQWSPKQFVRSQVSRQYGNGQ